LLCNQYRSDQQQRMQRVCDFSHQPDPGDLELNPFGGNENDVFVDVAVNIRYIGALVFAINFGQYPGFADWIEASGRD
jgi:hypothetical protein